MTEIAGTVPDCGASGAGDCPPPAISDRVPSANLFTLTAGPLHDNVSPRREMDDMREARVEVTLDRDMLRRLDLFVQNGRFPNRSRAVQEAIGEMLTRLRRERLTGESAKLDRAAEQTMADEALLPPTVQRSARAKMPMLLPCPTRSPAALRTDRSPRPPSHH